MDWPFRRFTKAFDAFQRRTLCDEWRARKVAHIAACFANTNLDSEQNDRQAIIAQLEETYDNVMAQIWNGGPSEDEQQAEDETWNSSFMNRGRMAVSRMDEQSKQVHMVQQSASSVAAPRPFMMPGEEQIGALPE